MLVLSLNKSVLYKKLESIVGSENLTDKETIMEAYTATTFRVRLWFGEKEYIEKPKKPDFIVRPGSTEEIQEIVRLTNEHKLPIIPMGTLTGQYASGVPLEGGIMMDLSRMKNIEIDEELLTVTLELGVTFAQAYRKLATKGTGLLTNPCHLPYRLWERPLKQARTFPLTNMPNTHGPITLT